MDMGGSLQQVPDSVAGPVRAIDLKLRLDIARRGAGDGLLPCGSGLCAG